ncbi:MAG: GTP-binding protein [Candidatus Hadarchaeum yellowstonense]|jgi:GTP-binding protein EngB required for normal cell division|uniref:Probable GTP-binding protein EngB n=1 Tax=Hadarchaeum yellowstonense TaxID=1776334 RepID=A0A147JV00_HADYE|nr:MAG: GTP-binding protein [Candidatus Hadarchaeum yellowstonense]
MVVLMEIVLVGRSNVGKSSVIRQLTGKKIPIGKRPGVTRRITRYKVGRMEIVDMPGFGFMSGVPQPLQEKIKTEIVHYLEKNRDRIMFAMEVIDARAFSEIVERWQRRGQIPVDVEMFSFLNELNLNPLVVANKIDLIQRGYRDVVLDDICDKLGLPPPWRQWIDTLVPVSAKTGEGIPELKRLIKQRIQDLGMGRLLGWLK